MFWKKAKPETEADRNRREAVDTSIDRFSRLGLHGNDSMGWCDAPKVQDGNVFYKPSPYCPVLTLSGVIFDLTREEADRITDAITKRVLARLKET